MVQKKERTKIFLTERQAAEFLSVAERILRDWRFKGKIDKKGTKPPKFYVRGKHIYYCQDELVEWITEGATDSESAHPRKRKAR